MITILLNPQQKLKELKIKRLYQLIVSEKLNFDESGEVSTRLTVTKLVQFYHMKETRNFVFMTFAHNFLLLAGHCSPCEILASSPEGPVHIDRSSPFYMDD